MNWAVLAAPAVATVAAAPAPAIVGPLISKIKHVRKIEKRLGKIEIWQQTEQNRSLMPWQEFTANLIKGIIQVGTA